MFGHKNVSVLDGGYNKWVADGYEVTDQEPVVIPVSSFFPSYTAILLYHLKKKVYATIYILAYIRYM